MKTNKLLVCTTVMLFLALTILALGIEAPQIGIAEAVSNVTSRYQMEFDYTNTVAINGSDTVTSGSGYSASVRTHAIGTTTNFQYENISMQLWGSSHNNNTQNFSKGSYINSNEIHIEATCGSAMSQNIEIKDNSGSVVASARSSSLTTTLSDGNYSVICNCGYQGTLIGSRTYVVCKATMSSSFTIDTTAPTVTLSCGDNGFTMSSVKVTYSDNIGVASAKSASSTSSSFPSVGTNDFANGKEFSGASNYTITVVDKAGNSTTKHFTIDTTAPTLSLSGVSDGGFTKGNVSATWQTNVGGINAQLVNSSDALTVKYSVSTGSSFPTSATTSYSSGTSLTNAGNYLITISDKAGNSTSYKFTIDKSAPTLTLSGVSDGGFTKGNVSATWGTSVGGATAQLVNSSDALTVKYAMSTGSSFPTSATSSYSSGTVLSTEGKYIITISDKAGNSTSYKFTIDRTDPVIKLSGGTTQDKGFAKSAVKVEYSDSNLQSYTYKRDSSAEQSFNSGTQFADEGVYVITVLDKAGNSASVSFTVDTTAPIISCDLLSEAFTNKTFSVKASDKYFSNLFFKTPDSVNFSEQADMNYSVAQSATNGTYQFYATDKAGNQSAKYTIYFDTVAPVLSNIISGSFYKGQVSVLWDVNGSVLNSSDEVTAKFATSLTNFYPSAVQDAYTRGRALSEDGNYLFRIQDKAGNYTDYNFTIDNHAPSLNLEGVTNGGFTQGTVSAAWPTTVGGVNSQLMNSNDVLTVNYAQSLTGEFPREAVSSYSANTRFEADGNYLLTIADKAGNSASYKFTIDKVAPVLSFDGLVDGLSYKGSQHGFSATWQTTVGGVNSQLMNSSDVLTVKYAHNAGTAFPEQATSAYSRNSMLSDEGYYTMSIADSAGNSTSYQIIVDCTPPSTSKHEEFINHAFAFTATDLHNAVIKYKLNDGGLQENKSGKYDIALDKENFGVWQFYAIDDMGNQSEVQTVHLYYREDFGNFDNIKNGYTQSTWYTVSLPTRIYTSIAGTYSFSSREYALNFAIAKEWEYRVEELDGSNRWSYVNITNEAVSQIYTSRDELDAAVLKYASRYISERIELKLGHNSYPNPTDENGEAKVDALTSQQLTAPQFLSTYADSPLLFVQHDFEFVRPIVGVSGNTVSAKIKYIADDERVKEGKDITLAYGSKLSEILTGQGAYMQGYYLVTESDLCGNSQSYLVYLDMAAPQLSAQVTYGDGRTDRIDFTAEFVERNAGVMLYTKLDLDALLDNIDDNVMVALSGRGFNDKVFVKGDDLPILTYDEGYYGQYAITVYDRSGNNIAFNVRIAGENAYITHTSLTNEIKCTLNVVYDSANNGITDIHLYKVSYTGEYVELKVDSDDTPVNASTMTYILRTGGKYVVKITDIFGRTVETEPMFYMKGLPNGALKGVKEGGITNQDVSFEYISGTNIYLYAYISQEWVRHDEILEITQKEGYSIASITANAENSLIYKFFLYVEEDMNLFVEYRFEIDCIAPTVEAKTEDGNVLEPNTVTSSNFSIDWSEADVTARYYSKNDPLGEYGEGNYTKRTILSKAGEYVFTFSDRVGNKISFSITLDNVVEFTISGVYSMLDDGSYISKNNLILTVTERTAQFVCEASNDINILNGGTISEDGIYVFTIEDLYGNMLTITIIIDKLPPTPKITSASGKQIAANGATRESFSVSCDEENVSIMLRSGAQYALYNGDELMLEGVYTFRMSDRMGNTVTFTVEIDLSVKYTLKGTYKLLDENAYISRYNMTVVVDEEYESFSVENNSGLTFAPGEKVSEEGEYQITIKDKVGNEAKFTLVIDLTAPTPKVTAEDGGIVSNGKTKQSFTVSCDEEGSTIRKSNTAASSGSLYGGEQITDVGVYYFHVFDFVGNEAVFSVEIDRTVDFVVKGNYKVNGAGAYVSNNSLTIVMREEYSDFEELSGQEIAAGVAITQEGKYSVSVTDMADNTVTIEIVIDTTAPTFEIKTEGGGDIEPGDSTNQSFKVQCEEADSVIRHSTNGTKYDDYDGSYISKEAVGTHYFRVEDFAGNHIDFVVVMDGAVSFIVQGAYILNEQGAYVSAKSLSISLREAVMRFEVQANNGLTFAAGETVTEEGKYQVTIEDEAGNVAEVTLIIDKTPPAYTITSISEQSVEPNKIIKEGFRVSCDEANASIVFSSSNIRFSTYDGSACTSAGVYYFKVSDPVGNVATFTVEIDLGIAYVVKGNYINSGNMYASKSSLSIELKEEVMRFDVQADNGHTFAAGDVVEQEGKYQVTITDLAGNVAVIELVIDKTAPAVQIEASDGSDVAMDSSSRLPFKVSVEEENATITYSTNGTKYEPYNGEQLDEERKYFFVVSDYLGNSCNFTITVDASVSFALKGSYVEAEDNLFVSQYGVSILVEEDYTEFTVNGVVNQSVIAGERITVEGSYDVHICDVRGNTVDFVLNIDKTAPIITANIENGAVTKEQVHISIEGAARAYYKAVSGEIIDIDTLCDISEEGSYTITATDVVGNQSTFKFKIDSSVDFLTVPAIIPGQIIASDVSFNFNEKVTTVLMLNEEEIPFAAHLSTAGQYRLSILDEVGNICELDFTIVAPAAQRYDIPIPSDFTVEATKDGEYFEVGDALQLSDDGAYSFVFYGLHGDQYELELKVDTSVPKVEITQSRNQVTFSAANKENVTYELYLDGELVSCSPNTPITQRGSYRLVVYDDLGNMSIYVFTLNYINVYGLVVIGLAVLVAMIIFIGIIVYRKRQSVR